MLDVIAHLPVLLPRTHSLQTPPLGQEYRLAWLVARHCLYGGVWEPSIYHEPICRKGQSREQTLEVWLKEPPPLAKMNHISRFLRTVHFNILSSSQQSQSPLHLLFNLLKMVESIILLAGVQLVWAGSVAFFLKDKPNSSTSSSPASRSR
ncbi:hypothetical protein K402DRAFT_114943 [Aulographum hederae CBS 113979]|uniref:Uncharacterized protein n=1 Tax=Aulographum hederae CBS 113979 TaxID=1176131 RepID=A0A6G1GWK1_9PEZI|nr:hypothetical protein K402DRAFT_114943 [Aulographum hederae CBS 113979]